MLFSGITFVVWNTLAPAFTFLNSISFIQAIMISILIMTVYRMSHRANFRFRKYNHISRNTCL